MIMLVEIFGWPAGSGTVLSRPNVFLTIQIYSLSLPHPITLSSFCLSKIRTILNTFRRIELLTGYHVCGTRPAPKNFSTKTDMEILILDYHSRIACLFYQTRFNCWSLLVHLFDFSSLMSSIDATVDVLLILYLYVIRSDFFILLKKQTHKGCVNFVIIMNFLCCSLSKEEKKITDGWLFYLEALFVLFTFVILLCWLLIPHQPFFQKPKKLYPFREFFKNNLE